MKTLLWIFLLCLKDVISQGSDCSGNEKFGEDNPNSQNSTSLTNRYYLVCDKSFGCCGVISKWYYEGETVDNVLLHVWRPTTPGGSIYRLISTTSHTASSTNQQDVTPVTSYLVKSGDCFGWYSSKAGVVGYRDGGNRVTVRHLPQTYVNTAGNVDWSGATAPPAYEWAIGGKLGAPSDPTFTGPSEGTISDSAAVNDPVITVTFTDSDVTDELILTMTSDSYFNMNDNGDGTGAINVKSLLAGQSGTHSLTLTATDLCGHTVTETVNITIDNTPPVLTIDTRFTSIHEDVYSEMLISTFLCSDSSGTVDVSVTETPGHNPPFFFVNLTGAAANEYGVYARSQTDVTYGRFDYYVQRDHVVTVICDDRVDSVTDTIKVNLIPNVPPVINNLPATGTIIDVDASTVNGTKIFTVDISDSEGDTILVSFTHDPSNCPVEVLDSGDVIIVGSINTFPASACDILVGVADHRNSGTDRTLSVHFTGRNTPPKFLNLDNSVTINEGTAASQSLITISASDDDGDTVTFSWSEPNGASTVFDLDTTTGLVTTSTVIDYESLPSMPPFLFAVSATDGKDTVTATLTVSIIDMNEPMNFSSSTYRVDVLEWTAVGTTVTIPGFEIIDVDTSDTHICTMDCGAPYNGYYQMTTACKLTTASLYKLDDGLPTTVTCTVTAEDSGGNMDTTTLIIMIMYDNNYTPTFASSHYDFNVDPFAPSNTAVGTVAATDDDNVSFGNFSYSLNQTGLSDVYFKIDGLTGEISTLTSMSPCACEGTTFTVPVLATDTGGLVGTSTALITVTYTTTAVYEDRYKTVLDDTRNIVWISLLMVLLVVTAIVTTFVCLKYVCMTPLCKAPCRDRRRFDWRPDNEESEYRPSSQKGASKRNVQEPLTIRRPPPPIGHQGWRRNIAHF